MEVRKKFNLQFLLKMQKGYFQDRN